ncbi:metallophosphoesterase [Nesterenkonia salmonea]|nr:metallophosphoesterase [Nesterenkonia salmonea]
MSSTDSTQDTDTARRGATVAIAGDWHANTSWAIRSLRHLHSLGVREVFQLGDFGIWPGQKGIDYLDALQDLLEELGMRVVVTPGNHEDYYQIAQLPLEDQDDQEAHAGFESLGAVMWARERIALLPRGHRFTRRGWSFVSLGGAPSVDFEHRITGQSWWIEEMITDDDVAAVVAGEAADVMLTHDSPEPWHSTDMVAKIIQTPLGRSAEVLAYAAEGRRRLDEAFQAVKPRVLAHGHYHVTDSKRIQIEGCDHETLVVATECDQMPDANLGLLHLPDEQTEGQEPRVEWVPLPPVTTGVDRSQLGVWPEKPVWVWETEEFLRVFDEGRSAHWNQLIAEAAEEPTGAWVHRMAEALEQSKNPRVGEFMASRAGGLLPDPPEDRRDH